MNYTTLGKTGLTVSEICLGTMTFGSQFYNIGAVDQNGATRMVERALDAGVNFFDTANVYSYGESETMLGNAIDDVGVDREDLVIATKVRGAMVPEGTPPVESVNREGLSKKHIRESCEASLNRLGIETIDLYQVHGWDNSTPMEETLHALHELVEAGRVHYVGVSNWPARKIAKALEYCRSRDWNHFVSLQAYYSLANRDLDYELLPLCQEEGLGILPWSPLSGGFLTGKYRRGEEPPEGVRRKEFDFPPINKQRAYEAIDIMDEISQDRGVTIPRVALAWLRQHPAVTSVIIGARNMEQLEDNLEAGELKLTEEEWNRLDKATMPDSIYPEWMVKMQGEGIRPGEE